MSVEFVECSTQAELNTAVNAGNVPVVRSGFFVAFDSATVMAFCSATVRAFGSATVKAFDSATVEAFGSATVRAFDSATVKAFDSATVKAFDSATVTAAPFVAVQRHGTKAKVNGGVLIQIPDIKTVEQFCEFYGLKLLRGSVVLFKCVGDDYVSAHGASYRPGEKPVAADWDPEPSCGNGLHFSPRPFMARRYAPNGTRFVACLVKLADLVVINDGYGTPDKAKASRCSVLHEVDEDGERVTDLVAA